MEVKGKKKPEVVTKIPDTDGLMKYISPDYNKIVCINVYDKFWGAVEVLDPQIKKFLETKDYSSKTDFIAIEKDYTADLFTKYTFSSKPKYFLFHKGNMVSFVDGLDFPKLNDEIEKNYSLLES